MASRTLHTRSRIAYMRDTRHMRDNCGIGHIVAVAVAVVCAAFHYNKINIIMDDKVKAIGQTNI